MQKFKFASLQSDFGRSQLIRFHLTPDSLHSIVVIDDDQAYERSAAALRIAKHLGGPWKAFTILKIIPNFLCDVVYNLIASNRYRMFGRTDTCMLPAPNLKERFLE